MPKVSVIVPVYNTEKYLEKCLDSLTGQTLQDIEIICVNDCSTDNSLAILQKYALSDDRIKVIDFKENKGAASARNAGIDVASGDYIGFVDSDDFVDLDFYEKLYQKASETGADVVKGNIYDYDEKTGKSELTFFYDQNEKIKKNTAYFLYGFTSAIYKTDFILKNKIYFPENIAYFEDPYFSIGVTINAPMLDFVDNAKYHYIRHDGSAAMDCYRIERINDLSKSVRLILNMINNKNILQEDYDIYVVFLMQHIIPRCSDSLLTEESNREAIKAFLYILDNVKFPKDNLFFSYFANLKQNKKDQLRKNKQMLLEQLHNKIKRK